MTKINKEIQAQKERESKTIVTIQCDECNLKFQSELSENLDMVDCPKCGAYYNFDAF